MQSHHTFDRDSVLLALLTLVAWYRNLADTFFQGPRLEGLENLRRSGVIYASIIILLGATLVLWARIQQTRLRGRDLRARHGPGRLSSEEMASGFGVDPAVRKA